MSPSLNCVSAVIDITVKISLLAFHRQREHGARASRWFLVTDQTFNMAPSCSRTTDPDKTLDVSTGLDVTIERQCRPLRSAWPRDINVAQAAVQSTDSHVALSGNMGHRHQLKPQVWQTMDLVMAFGGSRGPDITMASGDTICSLCKPRSVFIVSLFYVESKVLCNLGWV